MNKLRTLAAAAALLGGALSTNVIAQEASHAPADANRDGVVTEAERVRHMPPAGVVYYVVPATPVVVIEQAPSMRPPSGATHGEPAESSVIGGR